MRLKSHVMTAAGASADHKGFWRVVGAAILGGLRGVKSLIMKVLRVRGLLGILAISSFAATAVATWWYHESAFGRFSQTLGFPLAAAGLGIWIADYYYRKDAYEKRYRDVAVSVYTTWLLIAGVETILKHVRKSKQKVDAMIAESPGYRDSLTAGADLEAAATAASLTTRMAYMALTNLEVFSEEAVKSGAEKFTLDEKNAGIRQQIVEGTPHSTSSGNQDTTASAHEGGNAHV